MSKRIATENAARGSVDVILQLADPLCHSRPKRLMVAV